jgi:formylglycine-generating enzyme required for sulfatase activity
VSVQAFYIDQTEITNNEYRQFVYYVRDSIAKRILGDEDIGEHVITEDEFGEEIDPPIINWRERINWYGDEEREALADMFLQRKRAVLPPQGDGHPQADVRVLLDRPEGGRPQSEQCP